MSDKVIIKIIGGKQIGFANKYHRAIFDDLSVIQPIPGEDKKVKMYFQDLSFLFVHGVGYEEFIEKINGEDDEILQLLFMIKWKIEGDGSGFTGLVWKINFKDNIIQYAG